MKLVGNILFLWPQLVHCTRNSPQLCRHTLSVPVNRADLLSSQTNLVVIHMDIIQGPTLRCHLRHRVMLGSSRILPNRHSRAIGQTKCHPLYILRTRRRMDTTPIHK